MSYPTDKWFRHLREQTEPEEISEEVEELEEVENPIDLRVYEIDYVMDYPLGQGLRDCRHSRLMIRSIPNVTTVRTVGEPRRIAGKQNSPPCRD